MPIDQNIANDAGEGLQRYPLALQIETRDGLFTKDSAIFNGYIDPVSDQKLLVVERPGRTLFADFNSDISPGRAGLFFYHERHTTADKGVLAMVTGVQLRINPSGGTAGVAEFLFDNLFPGGVAGTVVSGTDIEKVYFEGVQLPDLGRRTGFLEGTTTASPPLEGFFMNTSLDAYFYNTKVNSLTKIDSVNYPYFVVGGAAWFNGRFYVMTEEGRIYASGINDPFSWSALDFINAIMSTDRGVGVWRYTTYLMAMGRNSVEMFYDSGAATGNPLRRVDSAAQDFGCKNAASVVKINNTILFVGHSDATQEVGVYMLDGGGAKKVSSVFADRIILRGVFDRMWAYPLVHNGLRFYALNISGTLGTLVYGLDSGMWFIWNTNQPAAGGGS